MLDFVVDLVVERVDLDGSQFSESNCRTLVLCACFTRESGNPGIRKSMFVSFNFFSWLELSWLTAGLTVLSRSVCLQRRMFRFMTRMCLRIIWHIFCVCSNNESLRSFMCHSNVEILSVFGWTCLDYTRPRSFWRTGFFKKKKNHVMRDFRSLRSLTNWIWSCLVPLETSR